jgi:toxin ParE1/3/4
MPLDLVYRPDAKEDLDNIFRHIAVDSPERAFAFVNVIRDRCALLRVVPKLGPVRPQLGHGLRIYPIRRRVVVVYLIGDAAVEIVRVFYGGRNIDALMARRR